MHKNNIIPINAAKGKGVLVIYTGGTIGMVHKNPQNPLSPFIPGTWEMLVQSFPQIKSFRFPVHGFKWKQAIDSSNVKPQDWIDIAKVIEDNYKTYQGFVVLHGTDTMTYTTSALSFLMENLNKPVVVTGSQLPIAELRSDAIQNLVTSIMIAAPKSTGIPIIPEVCLFFRDKIYRGNRVRKISSSGYSGFDSLNYPALGEVGEKIEINKKMINKTPAELSEDKFYIHRAINPHVASIEIFPGIQPDILKAIFDIKKLKGIVLKTYGAGNTPTDSKFLKAIEYGVNKGKIIVNVTQCNKGLVEIGLYETSVGLLDLGVINGLDMTPEAALTKMCVLFGQGYRTEKVKTLLQINQRGEQSMSIHSLGLENGETNPVFLSKPMKIFDCVDRKKINRGTVHIQEVSLPNHDKGLVSLDMLLNFSDYGKRGLKNKPRFINTQNFDWKKGDRTTLVFDTTAILQRFFNPIKKMTLSIVPRGYNSVKWKKLTFSIFENA